MPITARWLNQLVVAPAASSFRQKNSPSRPNVLNVIAHGCWNQRSALSKSPEIYSPRYDSDSRTPQPYPVGFGIRPRELSFGILRPFHGPNHFPASECRGPDKSNPISPRTGGAQGFSADLASRRVAWVIIERS